MRSSLAIILLLGFGMSLIGCPDDGTPPEPEIPCTKLSESETFIGDSTGDPAITLRTQDENGKNIDLKDGDPLLIQGKLSQGGLATLLMAGVEIQNMDACALQLSASLKDEPSDQVRGDSRTVNLITTHGATTFIADYAQIPVCPNQWSSRDIFNQVYELTVKAEDRGGRSVTSVIHVTPYCNPDQAICPCFCKEGYKLGDPCP